MMVHACKSTILLLLGFCWSAHCFTTGSRPIDRIPWISPRDQPLKSTASPIAPTVSSGISLQIYEHDGWKLTYRYKPPSPGYENAEPLVLIHPVGVGISSWFWNKVMEEWEGGAVYAPNLIGCGLEDGNEKWEPDVRGMSVPLGWVKAVESLIQERVLAPPELAALAKEERDQNGILGQFVTLKDRFALPSNSPPCTVVAQGGCGPIGVMLASRNPTSIVSKLVLTSPPTWDDMITAVPEEKLASNYNFYRSKWGELAFKVLESPFAVRLFSNLFLFAEECDDRWIELSTSKEATTVEARPPVMVFNSEFLQHRSYEKDLKELEQQTLVLSGAGDKRAERRLKYESEMKCCKHNVLENSTNVLPWEIPLELCKAIKSLA